MYLWSAHEFKPTVNMDHALLHLVLGCEPCTVSTPSRFPPSCPQMNCAAHLAHASLQVLAALDIRVHAAVHSRGGLGSTFPKGQVKAHIASTQRMETCGTVSIIAADHSTIAAIADAAGTPAVGSYRPWDTFNHSCSRLVAHSCLRMPHCTGLPQRARL